MASRASVSSEGWTGEGSISKLTRMVVGRPLSHGLLDRNLPELLAMASLSRGHLPAWLLASSVHEKAVQASRMGTSHGEAQSPGS